MSSWLIWATLRRWMRSTPNTGVMWSRRGRKCWLISVLMTMMKMLTGIQMRGCKDTAS
jgi:hypothetical protein